MSNNRVYRTRGFYDALEREGVDVSGDDDDVIIANRLRDKLGELKVTRDALENEANKRQTRSSTRNKEDIPRRLAKVQTEIDSITRRLERLEPTPEQPPTPPGSPAGADDSGDAAEALADADADAAADADAVQPEPEPILYNWTFEGIKTWTRNPLGKGNFRGIKQQIVDNQMIEGDLSYYSVFAVGRYEQEPMTSDNLGEWVGVLRTIAYGLLWYLVAKAPKRRDNTTRRLAGRGTNESRASILSEDILSEDGYQSRIAFPQLGAFQAARMLQEATADAIVAAVDRIIGSNNICNFSRVAGEGANGVQYGHITTQFTMDKHAIFSVLRLKVDTEVQPTVLVCIVWWMNISPTTNTQLAELDDPDNILYNLRLQFLENFFEDAADDYKIAILPKTREIVGTFRSLPTVTDVRYYQATM